MTLLSVSDDATVHDPLPRIWNNKDNLETPYSYRRRQPPRRKQSKQVQITPLFPLPNSAQLLQPLHRSKLSLVKWMTLLPPI